jgi:hypothetical protein
MDSWIQTFATARTQAAELEAHMEVHDWFPNAHHYDADITNRTEFAIRVRHPLRWLQDGIDTPPEKRPTDPAQISADARFIDEQMRNIMRYIRFARANYGTVPLRTDDCRCRSCAPARWRAEWL